MNRNDFLNMMSETVPLNRQLIGEVYELIDIFPYFQSAHLLLLKGLKSSADVKFENQLRNSAIHIADREVLYYLLQRKTTIAAVEEVIIPEKPPVAEILSDTEQTVIESGKNSTDLINEIENSSASIEPDEKHNTFTHPSGHSVLIASETDNEEPAMVIMLMDEELSPVEDKVFYMDPGFSASENDDLPEVRNDDLPEVRNDDLPEVRNDDLLELNLDEDQESYKNEISESFELSENWDVNSKKRLQTDLIDKFIIANPRIEPIREKSNQQFEEIKAPVLEEEGGFVTETLAKIYISQEYYSKAIDIYEKLSLKFPEKSSYFASQIEKVKEYIKK
jgi:hypothetical protein